MDKEMFEKGLSIRRSVLGAEFVDNALATADDFNRPFQELVTQYCWGEIWGRPGLDRKTRSLLNLLVGNEETREFMADRETQAIMIGKVPFVAPAEIPGGPVVREVLQDGRI